MPLRNFFTYFFRIAFSLCLTLAAFSCSTSVDTPEITEANIMLIWPTDETDPVFQEWTKTVKKELQRQGIRGKVSIHYSRITERHEAQERDLLNEEILKLRSEGEMPDLILGYGDAVKWLLMTNTSSVTATIPSVCYGLHSEEFLPYQYEYLEDKYEGGRWDIVSINAIPQLKENLNLVDSLTPTVIKNLHKPEYLTILPKRAITLLDVERLWADRLVFNELNRQMNLLDSSLFYNNLNVRINEEQLRVKCRVEKKMVFSCRSLMSPSWNIKSEAIQLSTTWAFYPQKSSNFFIQSKHDYKSLSLVNGPSFLPYYTMVAEDFLINEKCIGGFFPVFEEQIKDAVNAGLRLLKGEKAQDIGTLEHRNTYNLNWNVLRSFGLDVNKVLPEGVKVYNHTLKDRNPDLYLGLVISLIALLALFLAASTISIYYYSKKNRINSAKLHQYAVEILSNNDILKQLMELTDFKTWELKGDPDAEPKHIKTNAFFRDKLKKFIHIEEDGTYSLQVHCSIDGASPHWYEIRMTVGHDQDGKLTRRGIIINNDKQKELEAIAAETNRLIISTRTREGFIASMNHEIRTPLNSIVGYTQLLSMPDMPIEEEEFKEYRDAIESNASILKNTINNILTSTKLNRSLVTVHKEPFELGELANYCQQHNVAKEASEELLTIAVDKLILFEILDLLLDNALRFSERTEGIRIGWGRSREAGWSAEIWVRDKGIGINPKYHELIFDRFFKVNSFSSGCGLGLYICKSYVEMLGGEISVKSKEGEGAEFRIRLA